VRTIHISQIKSSELTSHPSV